MDGHGRVDVLAAQHHRTRHCAATRCVSNPVLALPLRLVDHAALGLAFGRSGVLAQRHQGPVLARRRAHPGLDAVVHRLAQNSAGRHDRNWLHRPHLHHDGCGLVLRRAHAPRPLDCRLDWLCRRDGGGHAQAVGRRGLVSFGHAGIVPGVCGLVLDHQSADAL